MAGKTCFTCGAAVSDHAAYCDDCVAEQLAEQGDELAAFDAYHAWADSVSGAVDVASGAVYSDAEGGL